MALGPRILKSSSSNHRRPPPSCTLPLPCSLVQPCSCLSCPLCLMLCPAFSPLHRLHLHLHLHLHHPSLPLPVVARLRLVPAPSTSYRSCILGFLILVHCTRDLAFVLSWSFSSCFALPFSSLSYHHILSYAPPLNSIALIHSLAYSASPPTRQTCCSCSDILVLDYSGLPHTRTESKLGTPNTDTTESRLCDRRLSSANIDAGLSGIPVESTLPR